MIRQYIQFALSLDVWGTAILVVAVALAVVIYERGR